MAQHDQHSQDELYQPLINTGAVATPAPAAPCNDSICRGVLRQ
jgi:hypothetical protein